MDLTLWKQKYIKI
uniref:Uncharacterized protein n=1 Tax=Lepeophtheirus salmonis TaxID=72036 RepID=A0A0K2SZ46_LEPSM